MWVKGRVRIQRLTLRNSRGDPSRVSRRLPIGRRFLRSVCIRWSGVMTDVQGEPKNHTMSTVSMTRKFQFVVGDLYTDDAQFDEPS